MTARRAVPPPLLHNDRENGLMLVLREALGAGAAPEDPVPVKLRGNALAAAVAAFEALWCWCEATLVHATLVHLLGAATVRTSGPRSGACEVRDGAGTMALFAAARCAALRDGQIVLSRAGACMGMSLWLSWRLSHFFGQTSAQLLARMRPREGLSATASAACFILLAAGVGLQALLQQALGRQLFSLDNLVEPQLGLSGVRIAELVLVAPVREEVLFRFFILHILRNRVSGRSSSILAGVFFGLIHLANASNRSHYHSIAYVHIQVLLSSLIGIFLGTRVLLTGAKRNLGEPLALHVTNNLASALLSTASELDVSDPFVLFSLAQTVALFGFLLRRDLAALALEAGKLAVP
jgi:membrane protease YdiL (CAAX protease family)